MDVLNVVGLEKTYGRRKVVNGVSMRVGTAEIVGLLGPNGAGKSTSFRMTCGLVLPDRGQVFLGGEEVTYWPMYRRAREGGMGYLAQESSVFSQTDGRAKTFCDARTVGVGRKDRKLRTMNYSISSRLHIYVGRGFQAIGWRTSTTRDCTMFGLQSSYHHVGRTICRDRSVTVQSIQQTIFDLRDTGISILITDHAALESWAQWIAVMSSAKAPCSAREPPRKSRNILKFGSNT